MFRAIRETSRQTLFYLLLFLSVFTLTTSASALDGEEPEEKKIEIPCGKEVKFDHGFNAKSSNACEGHTVTVADKDKCFLDCRKKLRAQEREFANLLPKVRCFSKCPQQNGHFSCKEASSETAPRLDVKFAKQADDVIVGCEVNCSCSQVWTYTRGCTSEPKCNRTPPSSSWPSLPDPLGRIEVELLGPDNPFDFAIMYRLGGK